MKRAQKMPPAQSTERGVVVHGENVPETKNGAREGAAFRRGRWFAVRIGNKSVRL
jgi:hypothetical protein